LCVRALIKEQARKELEREQKTDAEIEKLKSVYGERDPEMREAPEQVNFSFFSLKFCLGQNSMKYR
jgi:hypothetical protein